MRGHGARSEGEVREVLNEIGGLGKMAHPQSNNSSAYELQNTAQHTRRNEPPQFCRLRSDRCAAHACTLGFGT
ncbi:uncharacterized protein SPSK_04756 [Sporothrix schenckii 1099-18]|uniref:Uncharacterized protein n=1 Tax=Sporothrix schenckii 1099-18 TaxID=1397361 RepID=A0A0F2M4W2_SPOSC|nr:uncharacterized protein SPSK_04756 [Sporothrix schenckii 1099-18]KJR83845.1 hypothetical protein SPSK_04756 [Sporothrix schenckii 1099-18]